MCFRNMDFNFFNDLFHIFSLEYKCVTSLSVKRFADSVFRYSADFNQGFRMMFLPNCLVKLHNVMFGINRNSALKPLTKEDSFFRSNIH